MGQTIGGDSNVAFTIWWNNPSETIYNNNAGIARPEQANDAIQNIWIYENSFGTTGNSVGTHAGTYVAHLQPNTASGAWNVTLPAAVGDWFVVKFQDSYTFAIDPTNGRTVSKDLTWSAPVWYDPANADPQLLVDDTGPTSTPSPTPVPPTPAPGSEGCSAVKLNELLPSAGSVYPTEWIELYNPTNSTADISNCVIDDIVGGGGAPYSIPAGTTIAPYGFWTHDMSNYLNNSGDTANLLDTDGVTVIDSFSFSKTGNDLSWYRLPDGGPWQTIPTSSPTKGVSNSNAVPTGGG
jgi:hypothetical protein